MGVTWPLHISKMVKPAEFFGIEYNRTRYCSTSIKNRYIPYQHNDCVIGYYKDAFTRIAIIKTARKYFAFIRGEYNAGCKDNNVYLFFGDNHAYNMAGYYKSLAEAIRIIEGGAGKIVDPIEWERMSLKIISKAI